MNNSLVVYKFLKSQKGLPLNDGYLYRGSVKGTKLTSRRKCVRRIPNTLLENTFDERLMPYCH